MARFLAIPTGNGMGNNINATDSSSKKIIPLSTVFQSFASCHFGASKYLIPKNYYFLLLTKIEEALASKQLTSN